MTPKQLNTFIKKQISKIQKVYGMNLDISFRVLYDYNEDFEFVARALMDANIQKYCIEIHYPLLCTQQDAKTNLKKYITSVLCHEICHLYNNNTFILIGLSDTHRLFLDERICLLVEKVFNSDIYNTTT
jgi:hypothetical protein